LNAKITPIHTVNGVDARTAIGGSTFLISSRLGPGRKESRCNGIPWRGQHGTKGVLEARDVPTVSIVGACFGHSIRVCGHLSVATAAVSTDFGIVSGAMVVAIFAKVVGGRRRIYLEALFGQILPSFRSVRVVRQTLASVVVGVGEKPHLQFVSDTFPVAGTGRFSVGHAAVNLAVRTSCAVVTTACSLTVTDPVV